MQSDGCYESCIRNMQRERQALLSQVNRFMKRTEWCGREIECISALEWGYDESGSSFLKCDPSIASNNDQEPQTIDKVFEGEVINELELTLRWEDNIRKNFYVYAFNDFIRGNRFLSHWNLESYLLTSALDRFEERVQVLKTTPLLKNIISESFHSWEQKSAGLSAVDEETRGRRNLWLKEYAKEVRYKAKETLFACFNQVTAKTELHELPLALLSRELVDEIAKNI